MLDRLPAELLLRVCCASDRPTLVAATSCEVRAQLPRVASPADAWRLNDAPGDEVVTDVWSTCGAPAVRGQLLVRVGRADDVGRASLARHVAELHARLRGGLDAARHASRAVRDALGPGAHATPARVAAVRYLAWLGRRFACVEAAVPRNLTHLGLAPDAPVCREALAAGWGAPSDWAAVVVVMSGASDMRPDLDGRKAAALGVVLDGAPDALADAAYRTTAVGACIDAGLVRSLGVLLDASARYTTPADLRAYVVRAAEASDDAVLGEVMRRVDGPPTADGRAALGCALVVAAENDRVAACGVLLAHPWLEDPAIASASAGAALVACSRLNRVAAAQLMCTRAPPARDVDRALETSAHWDFLSLTRALLPARPSVAALGRGMWIAALHGATDTVACLRAALAQMWDRKRVAVQQALDSALDAATSARSAAAVRAMLVPGAPGPSPRAQADALRSACFAGEGELVRALLSEPLTRTMNRNTLNACFLESARRHDLATVRALVGLVREPVVAEGLRCVMVANDQELTGVLLTAATRPVSSAGLRRAVLAALAAGVGLTVRTLLDECSPSRRAELESAVVAALPDDATFATPEYRAVATLVREGAADALLAVPDVWRTMLRVAAEAADADVLRVVAARAPSAPDERDVAAACRAMEAVVRAGDVDLVEMLAPAFGRLASVDAVDHAFLVATAWGTRGDTGALHMLARHFRPSRSAVRRCRLLLAPLDRRRAAPAAAALAQMQRRLE